MSSPITRKSSVRTPTLSRKKRENEAIDEPESTTRPTKRTNGFAFLGNDQEELEELCHSFSIIADQRWRTPHASIAGWRGHQTTGKSEYMDRPVDGSQDNSPIRQNNRMLFKLYSRPISRNPLNFKTELSRPQPQFGTPTKPGVSLGRISIKPGEHRIAHSRRNDVEISYVNLLRRHRSSGRDDAVESELSPHTSEVAFYPPDYEKENMWLQVDFEEITTLDDEVDVDYYGSGKWVIKGEEATAYSRRSSEYLDLPSDERETMHVMGLRGGAGLAVESSENQSSEEEGGESAGDKRGVSTEVESEDTEDNTEAENVKDIDRANGSVSRIGKCKNINSAKGKAPERAKSPKSPKAGMQKSTKFHGNAALIALRYRGHLEQMNDTQWVEGMEAINNFVFY